VVYTDRRLGCIRRGCCSCASSRIRRRRCSANVQHTTAPAENAARTSEVQRSRPPRTDTDAAAAAAADAARRRRDDRRPRRPVCRLGTPRRSAPSRRRSRRRAQAGKCPACDDTVPRSAYLDVHYSGKINSRNIKRQKSINPLITDLLYTGQFTQFLEPHAFLSIPPNA